MQNVSGTTIARPEKRLLGFIGDYAIITLLRFMTFKICMSAFLSSHINTFVLETTKSAGKSFIRSKILKEKAPVVIDTSIFVEIVIVIALIILIAPLYNIITIKLTKLKTTIGKKLFAIYPQTSDGQDVGIFRIICHYIVSTLPIIPIAIIISAKVFNNVYADLLRKNQLLVQALKMAGKNVNFNIKMPIIVLIISIIILVIWYGMVFFTKYKLTGHDFICKTKFVGIGSGAKPFNIPFVYDFGKKLLNATKPFIDKIKIMILRK